MLVKQISLEEFPHSMFPSLMRENGNICAFGSLSHFYSRVASKLDIVYSTFNVWGV